MRAQRPPQPPARGQDAESPPSNWVASAASVRASAPAAPNLLAQLGPALPMLMEQARGELARMNGVERYALASRLGRIDPKLMRKLALDVRCVTFNELEGLAPEDVATSQHTGSCCASAPISSTSPISTTPDPDGSLTQPAAPLWASPPFIRSVAGPTLHSGPCSTRSVDAAPDEVIVEPPDDQRTGRRAAIHAAASQAAAQPGATHRERCACACGKVHELLVRQVPGDLLTGVGARAAARGTALLGTGRRRHARR
jgi:hypothetical protein